MRLNVLEPRSDASTHSRIARWLSLRLPAPDSLASSRRPLPWRDILVPAIAVWLATRLAYLLLTYFYPLVSGGEAPSSNAVSLPALFRRWAQWDGVWYIHIAQMGYTTIKDTAFFPLYPISIRLVSMISGPHWAAASLIASNLAAVLAFAGVALLAAQIAPSGKESEQARIAVTLFAAYPLTFFLFASYSDGLFAGLAALTLFFGLRRQWGWAALCGLLAALCRPVGIALVLPLVWEAFQRYRERRSAVTVQRALRDTAPATLAILAPIVGFGAYCAFLWLRFGDPVIFIKAESAWTHTSISPLLSIPLAILAFAHTPLLSPYQARVLLDLVPTLAAIVLTLVAARRAPLALTLYLLAVLYIITSEPVLHIDLFISAGRYLLAAVPLFAFAGGWLRRSEWVFQSLCWSGTVLQAILAVYFLGHGFIG